MTVKIYISGNYLYMDSSIGKTYAGAAARVVIRPFNDAVEDPTYYVSGVSGWEDSFPIKLSQIQTQDGSAYTKAAFKAFYETYTGKSKAGGSANETTLSAEQYTLLEQSGNVDPNQNYYLI